MKIAIRKPSPAMVVACIALAVALSGASYAAIKLPRNSVGTPQLKKNAVTSPKVRNGSLLALDFAAGQLPAGPQGPPGPTASAVGGPPPAGAPGPPPADQIRRRATITTTVPGKLLVEGHVSPTTTDTGVGISCGVAGACSLIIDIYVDGVPVPGASRTLSGTAGTSADITALVLYGLVSNLPAGTHTVDLMTHRSPFVTDVDLGPRDLFAIATG